MIIPNLLKQRTALRWINYFIRLAPVLVIICLPTFPAQTQELTLTTCYEMALQHHPAGLQREKLEQINQLNEQIITSAWKPQLQMNGQISYQSEVTNIDIPFPGFEFSGPTRDQYRLSLEAQQMIYDGGLTRHRNRLREAGYAAELQEIEVKLYPLLEQVNRHFFQHFILEENITIVEVNREEVIHRMKVIGSAIENGILLPSSRWALEAEILRLEQMLDELKFNHQANQKILEILLGEQLEEARLILPQELLPLPGDLNRPEIKLFKLQKEQLIQSSHLTSRATLPKVSGFVQGGYGKPGLNMLSNEFDFYYIAGIRLNWTLWDWQKTHHERQVQQVKASMIDSAEDSFQQNIDIALATVTVRIEQLAGAMEKDLQIITLQEQIAENSASQLQNGIIQSTDYLHQLNILLKAKTDYQTRRIRWIQSIAEYNIIRGNY